MKQTSTRLILIFILCSYLIVSYGQTKPKYKNANVEKLKNDLTIFKDTLEKIHPALYQHISKNQLNHVFDNGFNSIDSNMSIISFFMLCKTITNSISDGHMACNPPRDIVQAQLARERLFPLRLWFIDKKAFVYCDKSNQVPIGSEILTINNEVIENITDKLLTYLNSDGIIKSKKYWALNGGEGTFNFLYYWSEGGKESFSITFRNKEGIIATKKVDAKLLTNDDCIFEKKQTSNYLSLSFPTDDIAILTIKSFDINRLNNDEKYFAHFLDSAFTQISEKNVSKLIIDLRNNGGGEDSYGALLYSYLTNQPFDYYRSIERKNYVFPIDAHPNLKTQQPHPNNYLGKCYFLINGKSFSTTSEFCAIAKSNNRGQFIGEETGGTYYGNTGGEQTHLTLPYSKIRLIIPHRKYVLAVKKSKYKGRGIIPDYTIIPKIDNVLNDDDVQLKYALSLAEKK